MLDLPKEIIRQIKSNLDHQSQARFTRVSRFFNETLGLNVQAAKLLSYISNGMQAHAKELIQQNPRILCECQSVTDFAGRTFHHVSALQLACWNLDQRMWEMIIEIASCENQTTEILQALSMQIHSLSKNGIQYRYLDEEKCTNHFEMDIFNDSLEIFVSNNYQNSDYQTLCHLQKAWPINLIEELTQPNQSIYFPESKLSERYYNFEVKAEVKFERLLESNLSAKKIIFDETLRKPIYRFYYLVRADESQVVNFVGAKTQSNSGFRRCKETEYIKHDATAINHFFFPKRLVALNSIAQSLKAKLFDNLLVSKQSIKSFMK